MLPERGKGILEAGAGLKFVERPSKTYRIDFAAGRIDGTADGREAVGQLVQKTLRTDRFAHLIYSWGYGTEWSKAAGKADGALEEAVRGLVTEALAGDERILRVTQVTVSRVDRRSCAIDVTVESIYGTVEEAVTSEL